MKTAIMLLLVFLITFIAHFAYHLTSQQPITVFAPDGPHYLTSCQYLTTFLLGLEHGKPDFSFLLSRTTAGSLIFDGPITPGIPALLFALLGHIPQASDWRVFAFIYSAIQAISACLVSMLTLRLCDRNYKTAIITGILFGIFPSTLTATGRFCSEVPVTVFLLSFLLALSDSQKRLFSSVFAGIFGALVSMCKAVLIPTVGLSILWTTIGSCSSRKLLHLALVVICLAISLLPWAAYTKFTTGKISITAERGPSYNAAVATDIENDGWTSEPESNWVQLMKTSDNALPVLLGPWTAHPTELLKLSLRRYTRLFSQPWNSFRANVFGITPIMQVWLHILLLFLGAFGIGVYFCERNTKLNASQKIVGDLCAIALLGHLGYVVFQAIGRYAFSSIPLFAIFAAYGITRLAFISQPRSSSHIEIKRATVIALAFALVFVLSVQYADALTHLQESQEVTHNLLPGDSAEKMIDFSSKLTHQQFAVMPTSALILIDGDKRLDNADVSVNGHKLKEHFAPLAQFDSSIYRNYSTISEHTEFLNVSNEDLRQWRAAPVPISWINLHGANHLSVMANGSGAIIYADSDPSYRHMLSPYIFAHDQVFNSVFSFEPRVLSQLLTGMVNQASSLKKVNESVQQLPDSLRIKLAIVCSNTANPDRSNANSLTRTDGSQMPVEFKTIIGPGSFNTMLREGNCIRINRYVLRYAPSTHGAVKIPTLAKSSHLQFIITGKFRTNKGNGVFSAPITITTDLNQNLILGKNPNYITGGREWRDFSIEDLVPRDVFNGEPNKVGVDLFPWHWQQAWYGPNANASNTEIKDITVLVKAVDLPTLNSGRIFFY